MTWGLTEWLAVVNVVVMPVLMYGTHVLRNIRSTVDATQKDVARINGSIRVLQEWRNNHEALDTERHERVQHAIERIQDRADARADAQHNKD